MKPIHPKKVLFKIVNDHVRVHVRGYKKNVVRSDPVWLCVSTDLWFIVLTVSDSWNESFWVDFRLVLRTPERIWSFAFWFYVLNMDQFKCTTNEKLPERCVLCSAFWFCSIKFCSIKFCSILMRYGTKSRVMVQIGTQDHSCVLNTRSFISLSFSKRSYHWLLTRGSDDAWTNSCLQFLESA